VVSLVGGGGKTTLMFQLAREFASNGQSVLTTTTTKIFRPPPDQSPQVIIAEDLATLSGRIQTPVCGHVTAARSEQVELNKLVGYDPPMIVRLQKTGTFQWIIVEADGAAGRPLKAPASHEPVVPACSGWVIAVVGLDAVGKPLDDRYVFRSNEYSRLTGVSAGAPVSEESVARAVLDRDGILRRFPPGAKRMVFLNKADGRDRRAAGRQIARYLLERGKGIVDRVVCGSLLPEPSIVDFELCI